VVNSINILIPSMVRGGAERIVTDICLGLSNDDGVLVNIYVKKKAASEYYFGAEKNCKITYLSSLNPPNLHGLVRHLLAAEERLIITHLLPPDELKWFWQAGIGTIPVLHNSVEGWEADPPGFNNSGVPFVIACATSIAKQFIEGGSTRPVVALRHEVQRWPSPAEMQTARKRVRSLWGVSDKAVLIGMVGQFKSQKAYTRAIRVLALLRQHVEAKLMIVGGWNHAYGSGPIAYEATMRLALELNIISDICAVGNSDDVDQYYAAFDICLNTSLFEGLSISLLEAISSGCPIVAADVGGTREVIPANGRLIEDPSDISAYVAGILAVERAKIRYVPGAPVATDLVPQIWAGLNLLAASTIYQEIRPRFGTIFVTERLDLDGPSKSLVRLLAAGSRRAPVTVFLTGGRGYDRFVEILKKANVAIYQSVAEDSIAKIARLLVERAVEENTRTICFWNASPEIKLIVAKMVEVSKIRLMDVSPGPMLFDELNASTEFQRRTTLTLEQYWSRLDHFVSLYKNGLPHANAPQPRCCHVIPLGIPVKPVEVPATDADYKYDKDFMIGTVTRIVPDKKIEVILEMMSILKTRCPQVSITIVGGPDISSKKYFDDLVSEIAQRGLSNIRLAGPQFNVDKFISKWSVFVLSGIRQGCPNASLEAMSFGIPVVAMASGGLDEQILDGRTGYLVSSAEEMADAVYKLLMKPVLAGRIGLAGKAHVEKKFSLSLMVKKFSALIDL
jgi:glycosyltransferase involved in cell wall biosynthesis